MVDVAFDVEPILDMHLWQGETPDDVEAIGERLRSTIESIGHREIEQYNLARVDRALAAGTRQHAYVDRYFFWHEHMAPRFGRQLLFYRPAGEAGATDVPDGSAPS